MRYDNDHLYLHAIDQDPDLLEKARKKNILILPPTLVYALLKVVKLFHYEREVENNSKKIAVIGKELHQRLGKFMEHFTKVGSGLSIAIAKFNEAHGSWTTRLIPKINELEETQGTHKSEKLTEKLKPIEIAPIVSSNENLNSDEKLVSIDTKVKK